MKLNPRLYIVFFSILVGSIEKPLEETTISSQYKSNALWIHLEPTKTQK